MTAPSDAQTLAANRSGTAVEAVYNALQAELQWDWPEGDGVPDSGVTTVVRLASAAVAAARPFIEASSAAALTAAESARTAALADAAAMREELRQIADYAASLTRVPNDAMEVVRNYARAALSRTAPAEQETP